MHIFQNIHEEDHLFFLTSKEKEKKLDKTIEESLKLGCEDVYINNSR